MNSVSFHEYFFSEIRFLLVLMNAGSWTWAVFEITVEVLLGNTWTILLINYSELRETKFSKQVKEINYFGEQRVDGKIILN
jgi:predicted ferric reductase